jgi:sterol desaturase/sphingolipid hydroxylase (fatty acid hydroxylase superfamily)
LAPSWFTEAFWLEHRASLERGALLAAFVTFAVWETYRPRRELIAPTGRRWIHHSILGLLINSPLAWIFPASAVAVAAAARGSSYGLLNRGALPVWVQVIAAILLLDLLRYAQHRIYHVIPVLWRIHRVHHADCDYDWSTSLVFHPGEALLTQGSYLAVIAVLAPPPLAVLGLELGTIVQNIFEHANVAVPPRIDVPLRRVLITPDTHRIHHSQEVAEQNTNFGTVFIWWDRLFGTYRQEAGSAPEQMGIGLREFRDPRGLSVIRLLTLPFRNE